MNQLEAILFNVGVAKKVYLKSIVKDFNKKVKRATKKGECCVIYLSKNVNKEFIDLLLLSGYSISNPNDWDTLISW